MGHDELSGRLVCVLEAWALIEMLRLETQTS
jgi:hypothetical protein